ncbi:MAG: energy-coupled thiamine transporter ThiT [Firmicutes bacterium]|nr:energy-coupled thiamine transporter ThiT [Bacillota bacterium]MCL1953114.1 energy-coupled thiamine transporter ThiT [Bacillota bacterium]
MFYLSVLDGILIDLWQFWLLVAIIVIVTIVVVVLLHLLQRRAISRLGCCGADCDNCVLPLSKRDTVLFSSRDVVFGALALGLSIVLQLFTVFRLPFGGSITLVSVLPMLLFGYFFGLKKTLIISLGYALFGLLYNPYIVTPWSAILDYVIPSFALVCTGVLGFKYTDNKNLAGFKRHYKFFVGVALYFVVRLISHTVGGVIFWTQGIDWGIWHGDLVGWAAWGYSLTYNIVYLVPDTILVVVAAAIVLSSSAFVKALIGK